MARNSDASRLDATDYDLVPDRTPQGGIGDDPGRNAAVGYDPLPNLIGAEPVTQNGIAAGLPSDVGPQSQRIAADPILYADPPAVAPDSTPVYPVSGPADGAGSISAGIDGWHPNDDDSGNANDIDTN